MRNSTAPAAAVATVTKSGSRHPPQECARFPNTFPATDTPTYEKSEMNPIDVPANRFVEMFVAVTPVSA